MTTITISSGTTIVSTSVPPTTNYVVESGGILEIANGGTVSGLVTINSAGSGTVDAGGTLLSVTVSSSGRLTDLLSGTVSGATVSNGGFAQISGTAVGTTVC